jgi:hypothetical protein
MGVSLISVWDRDRDEGSHVLSLRVFWIIHIMVWLLCLLTMLDHQETGEDFSNCALTDIKH